LKQFSERLQRATQHRPETLEAHRSAVGRAIQLMRQDPGATLDWTTLAEIACMSRYHFLRIFEGLTGVSPHRFLIALRIESAKQLLLETAMEVNDVCLAVGYSSLGTFTRVFRELVGVAPGGFRQLAQKLAEPGLQLLLAEHLNRRTHFYPRNAVRAELQVPESFVGNIFAGLFNAQLQPLTPPTLSLMRQSRTVCMPVAGGIKEARLLAIGFPDPVQARQYFLPDRQLPIAVSPAMATSPGEPSATSSIFLKLQTPGIFDLPLMTCLPLMLLKAVNTKHVE
jgi:AraC family transcriptional regulator